MELTTNVIYQADRHRRERKLRIEEVPGSGLYDVRGTDPVSLAAELTVPNPIVGQRRLPLGRPGDFDRPFERGGPQRGELSSS
jgi:hypothetical protein